MSISRDGAFTLFARPASEGDKLFGAETRPESRAQTRAESRAGARAATAAEPTRDTKVHLDDHRVQPQSSRSQPTEDSNDLPATLTSSLESLSIDPKTGNARILSHKRIKELKSLRALMMTTAGSVSLNVHPNTSQDCFDETKRMKEVTQRCIQDCIEKNHADSTGALLYTPGYLETIGPSNFYISEGHRGHGYNERFQKAVEERESKHGIKMDPLRMFIENAAKNKQKLFQSAGVNFKM
jgi:hypothetical protein